MQNADSVPRSTSVVIVGENKNPGSQSSAFPCSHCPLIFKSKVHVFEHLSKVHGLDADATLQNTGFKPSVPPALSTLKCQHCDFQASSEDVVNDHLSRCPKKLAADGMGSHTSDEKQDTNVIYMSPNEDHAYADNTSLLKLKSTSASSKQVKVYTKAFQTITKFFVETSKSTGKSTSADDSQATLILQETSTDSNPQGSGVLQVSAESSIDMNSVQPYCSLQDDSLWTATLNKPKRKEESEEHPDNVGKRTNHDASGDILVKKAKLSTETATFPQKENTSESSLSNSRDFSFELSEDESEKKGNPTNVDSTVYFCKHCDYSDTGLRGMSNHYTSNHPYVRYNSIYIQDSSDQSATFRCLECPVEFITPTGLKKHYREKHPDSPNVFTIKSSELNLLFKCFLCPFITNVLKSLKEHHDEKHPNHEVGNSLFFCRYSVAGCKIEPSQQSKHARNPEKSEDSSPENGCLSHKEVKSTPLPQQPTTKGKDAALFKCNSCTFSHKSVVVMHVHYQKCHPEKAMTIDKIKQSACFSAPAAQQMASLSCPSEVESSPQKHVAHLSQSKSPDDGMGKPLEKKKKSKKRPIEHDREISLDLDNSPEIFYCPFCTYESCSLRSVVCHESAKHFKQTLADSEAVWKYSAELQKKKAESKAEMSEIIPSKVDDPAGVYQLENHTYANPQKLFYCLQCNYANPLVKGILYHRARLHKGEFTKQEDIIQYSSTVWEELERTKSQPKEFPFSTGLPFPLIHRRDRQKFFCYLCNYRHGDMAQILKHYGKVHRGCPVRRSDINIYTSAVLKRATKSQAKVTACKEIHVGSLKKAKTEKEAMQRKLSCPKCSYSSPYIYLLRRHLAKTHDKKEVVSEILKICFKQGAIQPGYYCEFCLYTHQSGQVVLKHYHKQHPNRRLSLSHVLTQLHAGPHAPPRENEKVKVANADLSGDDDSGDSFPSGQREPKTYPCSECSFQGSSLSSVIKHFRTDHPWTDKHSKTEVSEAPEKPVDSERSANKEDDNDDEEQSSSREFKCPFCPMVLSTHHGLNTHCGVKHRSNVSNAAESTKKVKKCTRVFACQHCPYINSAYQGVLAHSHKKHSDLTTFPSSIQVDMTKVQSLDMLKQHPSGMLKFSAFLCDTCSLLCRTARRLSRHQMKDNCGSTKDSAQSNFKATSKPPIKCKISLPKVHAQKLIISKTFLSKGHPAVRCQHCPYSCSTSIKLKQHMRVQHNGKYAVSNGSLYRCVLCSKKYFTRKNLAGHYVMKHGKDAYLTHFVPVYMQPKQKRSEWSASTEDSQIKIYQCPACSYVNVGLQGTLTHYHMKHPKASVNAEVIQTDTVPLTAVVGRRKRKSFIQGGYMCKKCSEICESLAKYKLHCQTPCGGALKDFDKHKNVAPPRIQGVDIKEEPSEVEIEAEKNSLSDARELNLNLEESLAMQTESKIYKCQMCDYRGSFRRYLHGHYKQFHKLDPNVIWQLLQKYNKRKFVESPRPVRSVKSEEISLNKCVKCPDSTFDSSELLLEHYWTVHRSDVKSDFNVLSTGERNKSTGLYTCNHCVRQLNGIRKLSVHMLSHREEKKETAKRRAALQESTPDPGFIAPDVKDEPPTLESVEVFTQTSATPFLSTRLLVSPVKSSPSKANVAKQSAAESNKKRHACKQCGRSFTSPKVLLSHERSHSAVAAIKNFGNLFTTNLDSSFSKYIIYKSGHTRPFVCSICNYRTTVLGLWCSHFQKKHQDVILEEAKAMHDGEVSEERVERMDTEPPELLKQTAGWNDPVDEPPAVENSLYLEPPDVRRQLNHYNLVAQRKADAQEQESRLYPDSLLHCELCSFTTGHLSSIRRHYLNRHGKKINRCKQCEFFTESRKVLEAHVAMSHSTCQSVPTHQKDLCCPFCLYQTKNKNNMIDHIDLHRDNRVVPIEVRRPELSRYLRGVVFRCHKCTFTSGSAQNLRLHLTRHDDVRPYKCRLCFFDCTQLSDLEAHLSDKHQVMRNHELVGQVSLDQLEARSSRVPKTEEGSLSNSELCCKRGEDERMEELPTDACDSQQAGKQSGGREGDGEGESPDKMILLDNCITEPQKREPDPEVRISSERGQNSEDGNTSLVCTSPESDERDRAEPESRSLPARPDIENSEVRRMLDIDSSVEDDILRNILVLDKDSSMCRAYKRLNPVKTEPDTSPSCATRTQIYAVPTIANISETQVNGIKARKSLKNKAQMFLPSILPKQPSLSREDSFPACALEQERCGRSGADAPDTCRDMPVLENEYLKDKMRLLESREEEKHSDRLLQEQDENIAKSGKEPQRPNKLKDKSSYVCELCGRKLASGSELKLHVVRHGM
ncbi:unnamed protein product [Ophioblennius macclurei]